MITKIVNGETKSLKNPEYVTIFHQLLESNLPPIDKTPIRLGEEGRAVIAAGIETTAWALTVTTFHILSNPSVLKTLRNELEVAMPDALAQPQAVVLEQLPYLSACIREGIRLARGVTSRLPRISPDRPIRYGEWIIPAGVPVSMTTVDVAVDENIFPNSRDFVPERWLDNPKTKEGESLNRYFVQFSKGSRACLGIK